MSPIAMLMILGGRKAKPAAPAQYVSPRWPYPDLPKAVTAK